MPGYRLRKSAAARVGVISALSACLLLTGVQTAYASQGATDLGSLPRKDVPITAFDRTYKLLDEFTDEANALAAFREAYPDFLERAEKFGLPELSVATAPDYKAYAMSLEGTLDNDEWAEILAFLDIYENPTNNETIENEVRSLESLANSRALSERDAREEAEKILPLSNGQGTIAVEPLNSGINLSAAQSYASKYATSYNTTYGYEKTWWGAGADCTNFASQILHAGGINMVYSNSTASGWWWRATNNRSTSWIQATTFANYMGSGYSTSNWNSFVNNVRAGDFIGYDSGGDGGVDHVGFVHSKAVNELYIAQHTTDYIKWDNDTGWPSIRGTYYRIRR